jgi:hypothetical protein
VAKKDTDASGQGLKNADTKAGAKGRQINDKGTPILRVGGVPGYNKGEGTPGWIKEAASKAAGRTDFNVSAHRGQESRWQGGAPPRKADVKEKIHGGQASRVGKDTD